MPPWGFWPLAVVGVMLFEIALGDEPSRRQRFLLGYLFGAGWMYLGMGWMIQLTAARLHRRRFGLCRCTTPSPR